MVSLGYFEVLLAFIFFIILYFFGDNNDLPRNWPVLGMLPSMLCHVNRVHEMCTEILGRTGGTFLLKGPWFANMDMLGTVDLANVHHVMSSNFPNFPKGPEFLKMFDVLGDGIFNSDADLWKNQRKLARVLINHHRFYRFLVKTSRGKVEAGLIPVLNHVSKQGLIVDLQDLFQRFTFDTTCILITSYDPGCLSIEFPDVPFAKAMDDAEEALLMRHVVPETVWRVQSWLGIGHEKKLSEAWKTLDRVINNYVSMKKEEMSKKAELKEGEEEEEAVDLLTSYLIEDDTFNLKRDDKFLRDTVLNLMLAGRDTTSSALTWFIWLVSQHPTIEEKIREELKSVIPEGETEKLRLFEAKELSKLVYLHAALCESLRLYPPVPIQHKEPTQVDTLPTGHRVHPKMKILFSLYAMGRMEFVWGEDCLEFKPERWISDRGTIKHEPSYKFFAFNAGPRTCLGKEVAFTQMKAVSAAIIHNYNVRVVEAAATEQQHQHQQVTSSSAAAEVAAHVGAA
ncbi:hypothetical protein ACSBR2_031272 [Camellia fascicularis]